MLFLVQRNIAISKKTKKRGRKSLYPFEELKEPGLGFTVPEGVPEERVREAARKWAKRYGWTFEFGRDDKDRLVISRLA